MDRISWKSTSRLALAAMVCLMAAPASAGITYNVTNDLGNQNLWSLAGTITVSAAGTYTNNTSAITAWNITASNGTTNYLFANNAGSPAVNVIGTIEATSSQLLLNTNGEFSLYSKVNAPPFSFLVWSNAKVGPFGPESRYSAVIESTSLWNTGTFSPTVGGAWVIGTTSAVPEIDPAGIGSVLALVTGALGLLDRLRPKTA